MTDIYGSIQQQHIREYLSMLNRITTKLLYKLTNTSIKIPELQTAKELCSTGKYKLAEGYLERVIDMTKYGGVEGPGGSIYVDSVTKLAACRYLNGKHAGVNQLVLPILSSNVDLHYYKYLEFIYWANQYSNPPSSPTDSTSSRRQDRVQIGQEIKETVDMLLNKNEQTKGKQYKHTPYLGYIAERLNNRLSYKKLLISLVERSPKSEKSENIRQNMGGLAEANISSEVELLHHMATILENQPLRTGEKQFLNTRVNHILKQYEASRPQEVYKALLDIIMSLIGEKHYMSAEGMIGYLKTQDLPLITSYQSQDRNLISNIYRMLVTRANNQEFETGWAKEEPLLFGHLVAERVIKAPLLGHSIQKLIL